MPTHGNRQRPMTREEIESLSPIRATKENPHLRAKYILQTIYVNAPAGSEVAPKVRSQRIDVRSDGQSLWKIEVDIASGATLGVPMGETVQRHVPTSTAGKIPGQPSHRPEWMDVRFTPKTGL